MFCFICFYGTLHSLNFLSFMFSFFTACGSTETVLKLDVFSVVQRNFKSLPCTRRSNLLPRTLTFVLEFLARFSFLFFVLFVRGFDVYSYREVFILVTFFDRLLASFLLVLLLAAPIMPYNLENTSYRNIHVLRTHRCAAAAYRWNPRTYVLASHTKSPQNFNLVFHTVP